MRNITDITDGSLIDDQVSDGDDGSSVSSARRSSTSRRDVMAGHKSMHSIAGSTTMIKNQSFSLTAGGQVVGAWMPCSMDAVAQPFSFKPVGGNETQAESFQDFIRETTSVQVAGRR